MAYTPKQISSLDEYLYELSRMAKCRRIRYEKCLSYLQKQNPMIIIDNKDIKRLMDDSFALID